MGNLTKLTNIGAELEKQLFDAGITTEEELRRVGSREAWIRIQQRDISACYMRLCALEGAIQGISWHNLDSETKESLKEFYHKYKAANEYSSNYYNGSNCGNLLIYCN